MATIKTETEYNAICERIEELLKVTSNDTPANDKNNIELDLLSEMATVYEEEFYPVKPPTLPEILKLRMGERNLDQKSIAKILGVSAPRISEYMKGKNPTFKIAREMYLKLDIDPHIVLGVES